MDLANLTAVRDAPPTPLDAPEPTGADEERRALRRGVNLLARRALSSAELRMRLHRDHPPAAVDAALARLEAFGFLNDAAWAAAYAAGSRGRERSASMLRRELQSKGIGASEAGSVLENHDDLAAARLAAGRRVRALARLAPDVRSRRLRDYLLRRGFSGAVAQSVVRDLLEDAEREGKEHAE